MYAVVIVHKDQSTELVCFPDEASKALFLYDVLRGKEDVVDVFSAPPRQAVRQIVRTTIASLHEVSNKSYSLSGSNITAMIRSQG